MLRAFNTRWACTFAFMSSLTYLTISSAAAQDCSQQVSILAQKSAILKTTADSAKDPILSYAYGYTWLATQESPQIQALFTANESLSSSQYAISLTNSNLASNRAALLVRKDQKAEKEKTISDLKASLLSNNCEAQPRSKTCLRLTRQLNSVTRSLQNLISGPIASKEKAIDRLTKLLETQKADLASKQGSLDILFASYSAGDKSAEELLRFQLDALYQRLDKRMELVSISASNLEVATTDVSDAYQELLKCLRLPLS